MNAYYENKTLGNRIAGSANIHSIRVGDRLISVICAIVSFLTCSAALKIEKTALCTALFFSFFGIIGSMDRGSIGLFAGLFLCAVIFIFEFLLLKNIVSKRTSK